MDFSSFSRLRQHGFPRPEDEEEDDDRHEEQPMLRSGSVRAFSHLPEGNAQEAGGEDPVVRAILRAKARASASAGARALAARNAAGEAGDAPQRDAHDYRPAPAASYDGSTHKPYVQPSRFDASALPPGSLRDHLLAAACGDTPPSAQPAEPQRDTHDHRPAPAASYDGSTHKPYIQPSRFDASALPPGSMSDHLLAAARGGSEFMAGKGEGVVRLAVGGWRLLSPGAVALWRQIALRPAKAASRRGLPHAVQDASRSRQCKTRTMRSERPLAFTECHSCPAFGHAVRQDFLRACPFLQVHQV